MKNEDKYNNIADCAERNRRLREDYLNYVKWLFNHNQPHWVSSYMEWLGSEAKEITLTPEVNMDQVEHPKHYQKEGRKECWDEFLDCFGFIPTYHWLILTANKYLYRAGSKELNPELQDLLKAQAYINKAKML